MKRRKSILASFLVMAILLISQSLSAQEGPQKQKTNSFWLDFGTGLGLVNHYDNGVIPYNIVGVNYNARLGFTDEWKRCHIRFEGGFFKSAIVEPEGNTYGVNLDLEFLYSCLQNKGRWHFWSGGNVRSFNDLHLIPKLENNQAALSMFGSIGAVELVQCDFAYDKAKKHPWLTAYLKFSLPLVGIASRPGFAYLHDDEEVLEFFAIILSGHETFAKAFPGCTTDIGLTLNLRNGNRIGISYYWDYFTTGKKGIYHYDNAYHNINLSFMFKI